LIYKKEDMPAEATRFSYRIAASKSRAIVTGSAERCRIGYRLDLAPSKAAETGKPRI
jgi:hypothetical protein